MTGGLFGMLWPGSSVFTAAAKEPGFVFDTAVSSVLTGAAEGLAFLLGRVAAGTGGSSSDDNTSMDTSLQNEVAVWNDL